MTKPHTRESNKFRGIQYYEEKAEIFGLPKDAAEALAAYIKAGIKPNDFFTAIINNNLKEAVEHSTEDNRHYLYKYVGFLYTHAPGLCWGYAEATETWKHATNKTTKG